MADEIETTEEPVVEAVVEAEVPVVEETPEIDWSDAEFQARATAALANSEKWGDPEGIEKALEIQKALETEEGITQLFLQAGRALGVDYAKIEALFGTEAAQAAVEAAVEEEDEDRVLTVKELNEILAKRIIEPQQKTQHEIVVSNARNAVAATLAELAVAEADRPAVLSYAQAHLSEDELDPTKLQAALRRGHAEYEAAVQKRAEAYIQDKLKNQKALPGSISASAPGGEALPEPQNVEEAKARVRSRLFGRT